MSPNLYGTRPGKRSRRTKAEMKAFREALYAIVNAAQPATVRQVFYQATVRGLIPKEETGYRKVQQSLAQMRVDGELPFEWIADNTRWMRKSPSYDSIEEALRDTAQFYRRSLWSAGNVNVEVWIEKDALAGVILDVTNAYDVPLMVSKGFASLSFLYETGATIRSRGKPTFIYHLGDHDPSGRAAADAIERDLRRYAGDVPVHFEALAVLPEQIKNWSLPSRPTKVTDSRTKKWTGGESVELDAIPPDELRRIVRAAIEQHIDQRQLEILRIAENSEREILMTLARAA